VLDCIHRYLRGWLTSDEQDAERELATRCQKLHAAGFLNELPISAWLLEPSAPLAVSRELFDELGWGKLTTYESMESAFRFGEELLNQPHEQAQAYAGWLALDPDFVRERLELRQIREPRFGPYSFQLQTGESLGGDLSQFLHRWCLSGFSGWELPIPFGGNFTGSAWPAHLSGGKPVVQVEIPVTAGLPTRYPLRTVLEEARQRNTPSHLLPWVNMLSHKAGGSKEYVHLFRLHHHRNTALASRYGHRFQGHLEPLDQCFADFLGLDPDRVKKLRLKISRALKSAARVPPQQ
jgi:hypothetical protein